MLLLRAVRNAGFSVDMCVNEISGTGMRILRERLEHRQRSTILILKTTFPFADNISCQLQDIYVCNILHT